MKVGNVYDNSSDDVETYLFILNVVRDEAYSGQPLWNQQIKYYDYYKFQRFKVDYDRFNISKGRSQVWNGRMNVDDQTGSKLADFSKYKNLFSILFMPDVKIVWRNLDEDR
jgi:hypothetical protein